MGQKNIEVGETIKLIDKSSANEDYNLFVDNGSVRLSHRKQDAKNTGNLVSDGNRVKLSNLQGSPVYAYGEKSNREDDTIQLEYSEASFSLSFEFGAKAPPVSNSQNRNVTPASDEYEHYFGINVELLDGDETVTLEIPDRAETITIHADGFEGAANAKLEFTDETGNVITTRSKDDSTDYETDGTVGNDIYVTASVASPFATVTFTDTSGLSNVMSYNVYAR